VAAQTSTPAPISPEHTSVIRCSMPNLSTARTQSGRRCKLSTSTHSKTPLPFCASLTPRQQLRQQPVVKVSAHDIVFAILSRSSRQKSKVYAPLHTRTRTYLFSTVIILYGFCQTGKEIEYIISTQIFNANVK